MSKDKFSLEIKRKRQGKTERNLWWNGKAKMDNDWWGFQGHGPLFLCMGIYVYKGPQVLIISFRVLHLLCFVYYTSYTDMCFVMADDGWRLTIQSNHLLHLKFSELLKVGELTLVSIYIYIHMHFFFSSNPSYSISSLLLLLLLFLIYFSTMRIKSL